MRWWPADVHLPEVEGERVRLELEEQYMGRIRQLESAVVEAEEQLAAVRNEYEQYQQRARCAIAAPQGDANAVAATTVPEEETLQTAELPSEQPSCKEQLELLEAEMQRLQQSLSSMTQERDALAVRLDEKQEALRQVQARGERGRQKEEEEE